MRGSTSMSDANRLRIIDAYVGAYRPPKDSAARWMGRLASSGKASSTKTSRNLEKSNPASSKSPAHRLGSCGVEKPTPIG